MCQHSVMRIGSFQIPEPVPELRNPHVIASLRPWIDAGSVGSLTLSRLEKSLESRELGSLATPGNYFDFTRYRPQSYVVEGQRRLTVPNTQLRYGRGKGDNDFITLHILEPHSFAEEYIDSIVQIMKHFNVQRYCRVGAMYDAVPHTRPLLVMGSLRGEPLTDVPGVTASRRGPYQGPTSIMNLVTEKLTALGVEDATLMVRLPHYIELEEDYTGADRLLSVLCSLYDLPPELAVSRRGARQYERISAEIERNPGVKALLERLEADYDANLEGRSVDASNPSEEPSPLSPTVEEFLGGLGDQIEDS